MTRRVSLLLLPILLALLWEQHPIVTSAREAEQAMPTLSVRAEATDTTITFAVSAEQVSEQTAVLWYDTVQGRQLRQVPLRGDGILRATVLITPAVEGLEVQQPFDGQLDYWWGVRDQGGRFVRTRGVVVLPPALRQAGRAPQPALADPFQWAEAKTAHLRIRYYPDSPAARDIEQLKRVAEAAWERAETIIPATDPVSVTIYLVPRVFWQGGVAYDGNTLMMTYADRNYTGTEAWSYFVHELVHVMAHGLVKRGSNIGGLLGEGVAVYAAGGHYGVEPIHAWAAALAQSERYVPICTLRTAWDEQQHEVAYLEGASFVAYLVQTYGLERFRTLYTNDPRLPEGRGRNDYCVRDTGQAVPGIGKSYAVLEREWLAWLKTLPLTDADGAAIEAQIRYFNLLRRYEQRHDPVARILPQPPADWSRELQQLFATPALTTTAALHEALLVAADRAIDLRQPALAMKALDELEVSIATNAFTGTLGATNAAINETLQRNARAIRLGDQGLYNLTVAANGPRMPSGLWTDYRWTINSVMLLDDVAVVDVGRVTQLAEPDGLRRSEQPYRLTLRQVAGVWRIVSWQPVTRMPAFPPPAKIRWIEV